MNTTRRARKDLKPVAAVKESTRTNRLDATLEFITPMFGGGVALNETAPHHKDPDPVTPVRGASLRGQLRAWWRRACCVGLDTQTMRAREKLLWGWASTKLDPAKGLLSITVDARGLNPRDVPVYSLNDRGQPRAIDSATAYGAFPLQPAQAATDRNPGVLTEWRGQFSVGLGLRPLGATYLPRAQAAWNRADLGDEALSKLLWDEVERAWLAFVTFGGLGGRTRRGFGAVRALAWRTHGQDRDRPMLAQVAARLGWSQRIAVQGRPFTVGEQAQKECLKRLRDFRQGVELGRNKDQEHNRPGRSRWPEPDEIRRQFRTSDPRYSQPLLHVSKAPRAAFGLPIIFHFKDRLDPGDAQLKPAGCERLASPVVLRAIAEPDGTYRAVALRLPLLEDLDATLSRLVFNDEQHRLSGLLTAQEQQQIKPLSDQRLAPMGGVDAVLEPFFAYFKS